MSFQYLNVNTLHFQTAPDQTLRLIVEGDRCATRVQALRAFPLRYDEEYIVLRDGGDEEIGVLRSLEELPDDVRDVVREQLRSRYFLPRITEIYGITERFGSTMWHVETDRGARNISSGPLHEAITEISLGRYLLIDVEKNRYEILVEELSESSLARFSGK